MTENRPLIGLVGRKSAGKSTVAEILCRVYGYREEAFALELKREVYHAFGAVTIEYPFQADFDQWLRFIDQHKNDEPDTEFGWLRPLLQFWGTEYRRNLCGENYWVDKLAPKLGSAVVVSDVRFKNEAEAIKKAGGVLWHVWRSELNGGVRDTHRSEQELHTINHDFWVFNDGPKEDLEKRVADTWRVTHGESERSE